MPVTESQVVLRLRGIRKSYAAPVLRDVDLDIAAGQVHALIGANGAGKSTVSRIISGLAWPDAGTMVLNGVAYAPRNKAGAESRGVHIVQQELNLVPTLSVAENLFLNRLPHRCGVLRSRELRDRARNALSLVGLDGSVNPETPVSQLGVGHQQLVEIAAALSHDCRVLILDEPTAALTDPQIDLLFEHLRRLRAAGVAILYISHRMDELRRIVDHATILRDGDVVCTAPMSELTADEIVRQLTGKEIQRESHHCTRTPGEVALRVERLSRDGILHDVSFEVREGEIFGIAGLVGSGRTELLRAVFGADAADRGEVHLGESSEGVLFREPRHAVKAGLAMIPEDRRQHGLLMPQPVLSNVTLGNLGRFASWWGRIRSRRERESAQQFCRAMEVHCQGLDQRADQLSGGNQQKVVIARWLLRDSRVYLFDEPTRGIDVSAKATVYHLLNELAARGKAVVFVSSEMRELLEICDRIGVMSAGRMTAVFRRGEWTQEKILHAALSGYSR